MDRAGRYGTAQPLGSDEAASLLHPAFADAAGVLLAVSGGPDSMALLALAAGLKSPPLLAAATVDHGLREASAAEAALAARQAAALGLPHATLRWEGPKPRSGVQEAAREARYALLAEEARRRGFSHVATAHHADDQAETVLMRLAAGSGVAGLAGMRPRTSRNGVILVRPLLGVAKARLITTCEARGIPYAADPSNSDPRYGRTRARNALETLAGEGLTASRLNRLAARAARAEDALAQLAERALAAAGARHTDCVAQADWRALSKEPAEIRLRALGTLARGSSEGNPALRLERLEALLEALDAAASQGLRLRRSIGDRIATLQSNGRLTISDASPRRRGRASPGMLLE